MKSRKYIVLAIASVTLLMGVILSELLAMVVSIVAIILYAFIMAIFVIPNFEKPKEDGKESSESHNSQA
jgi:membrane protein YdbS with pleckstrin-like domain